MARTGSKVVLNLSAPDNMKHVEPGDFIAHLRSFQGGLEKSDLAGKVSTAYTVIEAGHSAEPAFFRWVLKSPAFIQVLSSSLEQLRDGQSIKFGDFAAISLPLPPFAEQRRIADFLDDQVGRLEQIINARRLQAAAVESAADAEWNSLDEQVRRSAPMIPIRRVLRSIVDGPFGSSLTSSHYSDSGARVIRLGNIGLAEFRDSDKAYIPLDYAADLTAHQVQPGDLLMAGLGDDRWPLGRCVVAPADLGPAIVKADCYRIRLDARVGHEFAASYLSGPGARSTFMQLARGSTRARLNTDLARAAELPLVEADRQGRYTSAVTGLRWRFRATIEGLEASVALLQEYKGSLISAAVTGNLDVTTAGSGIPE